MTLLDRILRRESPASKAGGMNYAADPTLAYYVRPSGRVEAIKATTSGLSGYIDGFSDSSGVDGTSTGLAIGYITSVWVRRCVDKRATAVNRMPWNVIDARTKKPLPQHPLTLAIKRNPQKILRKIEWARCIWGESFVLKRRNDFDYVSDLYWLNNLGVNVDTTQGYISAFNYSPTYGGRYRTFNREQVSFSYNENPFNELRGLSPMESILDEVRIDREVARVVRSFYQNDARVGALLIPEHDLKDADAKRILAWFKENFQGTRNAGKPMLLPTNLKYQATQQAPSLDDVDLRESTRREICAAYDVPLSVAGAWDDADYQSAPEQRKAFYEETIIPECDDIADYISSDILPDFDDSGSTVFAFDYDGVLALAADANERAEAVNTRLLGGQITINQARIAQGDEPLPGGDVLLVPQGYFPVSLKALAAGNIQPPPPEMPQLPEGGIEPMRADVVLPDANVQSVVPDGGKQVSPDSELRAWRKFTLNNDARKSAARFKAYVTPEPLAEFVRYELSTLDGDAPRSAIHAVFDDADVLRGIKSYTDTRASFIDAVAGIIERAQGDEATRRQFAGAMRSTLRRWGLAAYRDGFLDSGVDNESFSPSEIEAFRSWLNEASMRVSDFGAALFHDGAAVADPRIRAEMWGNKSLDDIYYRAMRIAAPNKRYRWKRDPLKDSCVDCIGRDGQIKTMAEWEQIGLPKAHSLACKGWLCGCQLEAVND